MPYRSLDPDRIIKTLERLKARIEERFAGRGIVAVCAELIETGRRDADRSRRLARPAYLLRLGVALIMLIAGGVLAYGLYTYRTPDLDAEPFHAFQGVEAILNIALLAGAGTWFLLNLEARIKRTRILADLHELRAIAHVIDMHQLTKDPTRVASDIQDPSTSSSPAHDMTAFELSRYLDYCTEMLSLTGKLAAMYTFANRDGLVIAAVNEIEELTTNLSRKIWQKISIIEQMTGELRPVQLKPEDDRLEAAGRLASRKPTANETCSPLHPFALQDPLEDG